MDHFILLLLPVCRAFLRLPIRGKYAYYGDCMKRIGYTWNDEYRDRYYSNEKVRANLAKFIELASQPKSPETREKMRLAKLGKPKSAEHKEAMSEAHKFRNSLRKEIQKQSPDLPVDKVWELVRMEMHGADSTDK